MLRKLLCFIGFHPKPGKTVFVKGGIFTNKEGTMTTVFDDYEYESCRHCNRKI